MRSKTTALALGLALSTATAYGQLTPVKPVATPAAPSTTASSTAATATQGAPGVVTLSDIARQGNEPPRAPTQGQTQPTATPTDVPAITILDGNGKPIDAARERMHSSEPVEKAPRSNITLTRISRSGAEATAVLWVKGQHRKVTSGTRVLNYIVGEIKEDGVCLLPAKGKAKDKCRTMITFIQGV